jgi:hypothetical protein
MKNREKEREEIERERAHLPEWIGNRWELGRNR